MHVVIARFVDPVRSIRLLLDKLQAAKLFTKQKKIIIKPNVITNKPYPITSDPAIAEALILYIRGCSGAKLIIAEGAGDDTERNFLQLGWTTLAERYGLELVDLNYCKTQLLRQPRAICLKKFHMPKILSDSFVISLANLKAHHAAGVTLSLKNMFGIAPGQFYSYTVRGKPWTKEMFHDLGVPECIVDVNLYCKPDLAIIDGRIAQLGAELGGATRKTGLLFGGEAIAVDYIAARYVTKRKIWYIHELAKRYKIALHKIKISRC